MNTFENLGLHENLLQAIEELGFKEPMPVQESVIPRILENNTDIVALAQTGTGKTAAFGLPLLQLINTEEQHTQALILSPTRELCLQIASDLKNFSKHLPGVKVTAIYGGASFETQVKQLKAGSQIIVATPGRMRDMIERKSANVSKAKFLVLDEADEMLDMGFEEDVTAIIDSTSKERHTFLFSATMPEEVEKIALRYMHKPETISMGTRNTGATNVKHIYYLAHAKDRYNVLKRVADFYPGMYAIVFCRTRQETQEIADSLIRDGYNADALHGDLSQAQRDHVMKKFRERHLNMLVATDVAARGIDVDNLTHVLNYNLPDESSNYIHRSGRTGRAGKDGISISILNLKEKKRIKELEKQIGKPFAQAKIPMGTQVCEKQLFHLIDKMENVEVRNEEIEDFLPVIYKKLQWMSNEELIKRFVSVEFNRFLDYYRDAQDLNVDEAKERANTPGFTRMFMSIGRKDGLMPPKLIGLINDYLKDRDLRVGRIELGDTFTFIEIDSRYTEKFLEAFKGKYLNDRPIRVDISENQDKPRSRGRSRGGDKDGSYGRDRSKSRYGGSRSSDRSSKRSSSSRSESSSGKGRKSYDKSGSDEPWYKKRGDKSKGSRRKK